MSYVEEKNQLGILPIFDIKRKHRIIHTMILTHKKWITDRYRNYSGFFTNPEYSNLVKDVTIQVVINTTEKELISRGLDSYPEPGTWFYVNSSDWYTALGGRPVKIRRAMSDSGFCFGAFPVVLTFIAWTWDEFYEKNKKILEASALHEKKPN